MNSASVCSHCLGERKITQEITCNICRPDEEKLKPFNLERAIAGDPVVTREGRKVLEIYYFKKIKHSQPVVCVLEDMEDCRFYTTDGLYSLCGDYVESLNLFMAPVKKKYYMGIEKLPGEYRYRTTSLYSHKGLVPHFLNKIVEIEIEE